MMVKPPRNLWRSGILEVDDGILVAIKIGYIEERARAMHQPGELEVHVRPDAFAVEAGKQRRRGRPVKTLAVKKDPDLQKTFLCSSKKCELNKATRNDIPARQCQAGTRLGGADFRTLPQDGGLLLPEAVTIICKWKAARPVFAV